MRVLLASPRGFCAGVDRAIEIVERALDRFDEPVYVRHEIVHNRHVVDALRAKGAIFVEEPASAPAGARLIYSAHGVSKAVRSAAASAELLPIDATCPLVTKVHNEVKRLVDEGCQIVMIGHSGHVEVEGTMGQAPEHMLLVETVDELWQTLLRGDELSLDLRSRFRQCNLHGFHAAQEVTASMYTLAGSTALYRPHPLERAFRDQTVAANHLLVRESGYAEIGRVSLGIDPKSFVLSG